MANPWFRLYAEFATDPKVQMLSESDQRRLIMLFCLRCNGHVTLQCNEVTFLLRISNDEWKATRALFIERGFIDENNELLNWDKRQFSSDTSKNRVAAYRERKKQSSNNDVTLQKQKSNAIDTDTDTDTDINNTPQQAGEVIDISACPHQEIISLYAKHLPMGIQPKVWNEARQTALRTRWREDSKRQSLEWWDRLFAHIAKSDFLTGKVSNREGRAFEVSLDWIVAASNFAKIIEGKYDNKVAA